MFIRRVCEPHIWIELYHLHVLYILLVQCSSQPNRCHSYSTLCIHNVLSHCTDVQVLSATFCIQFFSLRKEKHPHFSKTQCGYFWTSISWSRRMVNVNTDITHKSEISGTNSILLYNRLRNLSRNQKYQLQEKPI